MIRKPATGTLRSQHEGKTGKCWLKRIPRLFRFVAALGDKWLHYYDSKDDALLSNHCTLNSHVVSWLFG